ncbi:MAG: ferredoxin--NADP reductase [Candidatus Sumerlaeaceae bacterium]|nr:ferredoxin--NADP reductase [Candidatus Sumerlaeaceae bacterium]
MAVAKSLNAVVSYKDEFSPGLVIMKVTPMEGAFPPYHAGQFAVMGLPSSAPRRADALPDPSPDADPEKLIMRSYSIASSPLVKDHLEFYVIMVPEGHLTPRLFELKVGDKLWVGPKITGMFCYEETRPSTDVVLLCTGTGLAPYISILRTHAPGNPDRNFVVVHGVRHSWELGYREELEQMQRELPNVKYIPLVSRPQLEKEPWNGHKGHIQNLWETGIVAEALGREPAHTDTHVFLCGHPDMIADMREVLTSRGWRNHNRKDAGEIHVESYW